MIGLLLCAVQAIAPATEEALAEAQDVIQRGSDFLIETQNPDGSWGGSRKPMIYDGIWSNPESHRSWTIATTGLAVMALMDLPDDPRARAAVDQGIDYLTASPTLQRPSDWDTDNTWGYVYGFAALVKAAGDSRLGTGSRRVGIEVRGKTFLEQLWKYQAPTGGWAYYDMDIGTVRPTWSTSFMSAVVILGILDAKALGWEIEEKRLERAVRALAGCRLWDGSYSYSMEVTNTVDTGIGIDRVRGSLSRIQVCNLALIRAKDEGFTVPITEEDLGIGLGQLFREHHYLDIARGRPYPHEAYHLNSGYFYFFGHYYAGMVLQRLGSGAMNRYLPALVHEIAKTQSADGSMIDYFMNDYGRPYGSAYGIGALLHATSSAP
ncbi:MAG: prenyltransferase/squalene oxidase repeat-containing protein [Planctomycetota bacterium]